MELTIIAAVVLIVIASIITIYNSIQTAFNSVSRGWADVLTYQRRFNKTLPDLERAAKETRDMEIGMLENVTKYRSAFQEMEKSSGPNSVPNVQALAMAEAAMKNIQTGFNIAVEDYPELKSVDLFKGLMKEISEMQEDVAASVSIFNREVENFNNKIQVFPNNFVNSMLNKKELIATFTDAEAQSDFDYKPNL